MDGGDDLAHLQLRLFDLRLAFGASKSRQQHGGQNADDADHHEKLNQGEGGRKS
jgi:hypothetical protein